MKRKRKPKDQRTTVILILLVLAAILVRLLIIYVSEGILYSKYNDPAIEGEYYRGTIYDSKGNLLALDVPRYNLVLDAGSITNPARLSSLIADYTTLSAIQIEDMLMKTDGVLVLESTLGNDGLEEFRSLLKKNDVSDLVQIEKSLERVYPTGEHGALLIGRLKDTVGAYGAEKIFEERLEYPLVFTGGIIKGEDVTLDFANPYITVDVTSNIGIPVQGNISITPVFADVPDTENSQSIQITVPKKESAQDKGVTSYWIAASDTGMPQGYRFVKAEIGELLKEIPDSIELNIEASTDRGETFIVEPQAEYELALDYDVIVPLEFGEDLKIVMDYTFPGDGDLDENDGQTDGTETGSDSEGETLPSIMGELLNMNSLGIAGSIESTLPLELALRLELLDSERKVIPSEAMQIPIQAGSMTHPSVSDLDVALKLAEGADGTDLSYIKMYFEVTSGNMAGEPVTEDSYIKATLKVKVPGGVTIDLRELGESEENNDGDTEGSAN